MSVSKRVRSPSPIPRVMEDESDSESNYSEFGEGEGEGDAEDQLLDPEPDLDPDLDPEPEPGNEEDEESDEDVEDKVRKARRGLRVLEEEGDQEIKRKECMERDDAYNADPVLAVNLLQDAMTHQEKWIMSDFLGHEDVYFRIRKDILTKFKHDTTQFVSLEMAREGHDEKMIPFVDRVYDFLNQYGFINSGLIENQGKIASIGGGPRKVIIIIGAGMAGVVAARKLEAFGHTVKVLEARSRIGGRCHSDTFAFFLF